MYIGHLVVKFVRMWQPYVSHSQGRRPCIHRLYASFTILLAQVPALVCVEKPRTDMRDTRTSMQEQLKEYFIVIEVFRNKEPKFKK